MKPSNPTSAFRGSRLISAPESLAPTHNQQADPPHHAQVLTANNDAQDVLSPPTLQQQSAIKALKGVPERKVLAWLELLRSIEPGYKHRSGPGLVSTQRLDAISTLQHSPNGSIVSWLRYDAIAGSPHSRQPSNGSTHSTSTPSTPYTQRTSSGSTLASFADSAGTSSSYSNRTSRSTPRSSLGQASSGGKGQNGASGNKDNGHVHYCTYDKHKHKPFYTCDGWKRHEKEHDWSFFCMPHGAVEDPGTGPVCALCGHKDPDQSHLSQHDQSPSVCSPRKRFKASRKSNMVKHLIAHGLTNEDSIDLANSWRYSQNKKAHSCGFCVELFATLTDRLNHIDNEHFKNGEDMTTWDMSNVIKGLLRQPGVQDAWGRLLSQDPRFPELSFRWDKTVAESLQYMLELGEDTDEELAMAAFKLGLDDCRIAGQEDSKMDVDPVAQETQDHSLVMPASKWSSMSRMPISSELHNVPMRREALDIAAWSCHDTSQSFLTRPQNVPARQQPTLITSPTGMNLIHGQMLSAAFSMEHGNPHEICSTHYPAPTQSQLLDPALCGEDYLYPLPALDDHEPWLSDSINQSKQEHSRMQTDTPAHQIDALLDENLLLAANTDLSLDDAETLLISSNGVSARHEKPLPSLPEESSEHDVDS